eukprot:TRINITY_DN27473_c0_g2_i5.p1 TRINITY_DN27473_c0_g2~~TRINITY_DN27473_c0_g2_i5.p1  ORF type:complete len:305 (+),score=91.27 TRINITY_DN27473_c0_g2_i5:47-916(+)
MLRSLVGSEMCIRDSFMTRPSLWRVAVAPLLCALVVVFVVTGLLLLFTFVPQTTLLASLFTPWVALLAALLLVFAEAAVVVQLIVSCCLSSPQDAVFDCVYQENSPNAEINLGVATDGVLPDGRTAIMVLGFMLLRTVAMVLALPLNLIPVVGTVLYLCVTGFFLSWDCHAGYFKAKGLSFSQQRRFVCDHWGSYVGFGFVAQLMEFVPGLNVIAYFSNFAGAALWAVAMDIDQMPLRVQAPEEADGYQDFHEETFLKITGERWDLLEENKAPAASSLSGPADVPLLES